MEPDVDRTYPRWLKIVLSAFIIFHLACLGAWLMPRPSPLKDYLLTRKLPLPGREVADAGKPTHWSFRERDVIPAYLFNTAQFQGWGMFAPNPVQTNRYAIASVLYQDGNWKDYAFPRLADMNFLEAWIEKRYRKLQQNLFDENTEPFLEDLAIWVARQMKTPERRPVRVALVVYESAIPRHDREELKGPNPPHVDYAQLLRDKAKYVKRVVLDYTLKQGDLP